MKKYFQFEIDHLLFFHLQWFNFLFYHEFLKIIIVNPPNYHFSSFEFINWNA